MAHSRFSFDHLRQSLGNVPFIAPEEVLREQITNDNDGHASIPRVISEFHSI